MPAKDTAHRIGAYMTTVQASVMYGHLESAFRVLRVIMPHVDWDAVDSAGLDAADLETVVMVTALMRCMDFLQHYVSGHKPPAHALAELDGWTRALVTNGQFAECRRSRDGQTEIGWGSGSGGRAA